MGGGAALAQSLLSLVAVCALAWFVLRAAARRGFGTRPGGVLTVLDRVVLEPRRTLYVVRAGDKVLLVGSGEHGLTTLSELDPATVAPPPDTEAPR